MSRDEGFLSRWSRRKHDVAAKRPVEDAPPGARPAGPRSAPPAAPASAAPTTAGAPADAAPPAQPPELPPVESLTFDSDFTPFMAKDVDPSLRRAALKTLLTDERFNVMDGLDVYIDDYTKPSPIPPEWYAKMSQMASLGDAAARAEEPNPGEKAEGAQEPGASPPDGPEGAAEPAPGAGNAGDLPAPADSAGTPREAPPDLSQGDISASDAAARDAPQQ
jgi:hypothetical protein